MITLCEPIKPEQLFALSGNSDIDNTFPNLPAGCVMFDIETTGFSAQHTSLYLIGAVYSQNGQIMLTQWFAVNPSEEADLITAFFEFLREYPTIISFNGEGFDIPYLLAKCSQYGLAYNFDAYESIDLFRDSRKLHALLKLDNYKQKTIEHFLGVAREDVFTGGELIDIYKKYVSSPSDEALRLLLLHNADDIRGLVQLYSIRSYLQIINCVFTPEDVSMETDGSDAVFTVHIGSKVPVRVSCGRDNIYLTAFSNTLKIASHIYSGELKYFYPNYKDYFYLPEEDTAIHKSVAAYVDKAFRTHARASSCYSRKTGTFLPQYAEVISPSFKADYNDKTLYFEIDDAFRSDKSMQLQYLKHLISVLLR